MTERPVPALQDSRLHDSPWVRGLLWICGVLALVAAAVGVVLPGLPTTPFVLLAAACFVRASPRAHAWLLASRIFGSMLAEWEQHRRIPRRIKVLALTMMVGMSALSVWLLAGRPWLQGLVVAAAAAGSLLVGRLPSR